MYWKVRNYRNEDDAQLLKLFFGLIEYNADVSKNIDYWLGFNWKKERRQDFLRMKKIVTKKVVVVEVDSKLVAYGYAFRMSEQNIVVIEELFVRKEFRGIGLGKELVNKLIAWARRMRLPVKVEVYPWNRDSLRWYKKLGFALESYSYLME